MTFRARSRGRCRGRWARRRRGDDPHAFDPDKTMSPKEQRRVDEFILYAIAAADEAIADSGWTPEATSRQEPHRCFDRLGHWRLEAIGDTALILHEKGSAQDSPFFIPSALINLASGQVSIKYGFKGPNHAW
jgi:3-oxoacyl-[acyl-carrier-protein] synthase II